MKFSASSGASSATSPTEERWSRWPGSTGRLPAWLQSLSGDGRDALLYGLSALFAGSTAVLAGIPLYREWGKMAVGPYAVAAIVMLVAARMRTTRDVTGPPGPGAPTTRRQRFRAVRIIAFVIVLGGATVAPLAFEVVWASHGDAALHVQPEVLVVERAGIRVANGKDPYQVVDRSGHILIRQRAIPVYELYYPYLPGMVVFGFSSGSKVEARLTDARIQFLIFTAVVAVVALSRLRPSTDARTRALQVLTVLPTAALPLATGGDDMPVVAMMLAGLVALQRRHPLVAGLAFGAAASLKFTAWPLVALALFAVVNRSGRRSWRAVASFALGVAAVVIPVVVPVALRNPSAFIDNVVRFPLGLAGVASPAASALPGHLLVDAFPSLHSAYVVLAVTVGMAVLIRHLVRRPPRDTAQVASLTGWVMLIALLLAPATRVGYLLYPINLFVWAWMLRWADDPDTVRQRWWRRTPSAAIG